MNDTRGAKWVRGIVKTVFVLCYIVFMWSSIHKLAAFFNGFEENSGNTLGSFALAAAFDVTALVTTIGVMFFRKSMPAWVLWIVWAFILAIAAYSFLINWEYDSHYQNMTLIMQPTGQTMPTYDASGTLHYVAEMHVNTDLLFFNPLLASGFVVFSLIYSIIAEFFGTKPPTIAELQARKIYLEETGNVLADIKAMEGKKASFIQWAKGVALETKEAVKEVTKSEDDNTSSNGEVEASSGKDNGLDATPKSPSKSLDENTRERTEKEEEENRSQVSSKPQQNPMATGRSATVKEAAKLLLLSETRVRELLKNGTLRKTSHNKQGAPQKITMSSIEAFQKARQSEGQNTQLALPKEETNIGPRNADNPLHFDPFTAHIPNVVADEKPSSNGHQSVVE